VSLAADARPGWISRLRAGLRRTSGGIVNGVNDLFATRRLDADSLSELEDLLILADIGVETAGRLTASLARGRFDKAVAPADVLGALADEIAAILEPVARPLAFKPGLAPQIVLVCGVNGSGKTTTIAKLAKHFRDQGLTVTLAAGDTFRAAAIEQLQIWGERAGCPVIAAEPGSDAAALAYRAIQQARAESRDVLFIDTAGRLHNKSALMAELQKMVRVIRKLDADAPHDCLLVLDATVGQNAHAQFETFGNMVAITGLVMTKLDGTAKGGVVVALADRFAVPVHAVGIGEELDDLRPFEARAFAQSLMGIEE
jgi:fused signal recognition particle receptor